MIRARIYAVQLTTTPNQICGINLNRVELFLLAPSGTTAIITSHEPDSAAQGFSLTNLITPFSTLTQDELWGQVASGTGILYVWETSEVT